jgi:hypothetical protein
MFDPHFRCTSTIIASRVLEPALAFYCGVLHMKGRLLPEDSVTLADIGISSVASRERNELLPED